MAKRVLLKAFLVMQAFARWNRCAIAWVPGQVSRRNGPSRNRMLSSTMPTTTTTTTRLVRPSRNLWKSTTLYQSTAASPTFPNSRAEILHGQLESIGLDANGLLQAAVQSIEDPTAGYDSAFGKSAIRTYRAFIYPKKDDDGISLSAAAGRTARQVDFLIKRHKSHQTEWVRHHDVIRDRRQVFPLILILDNVRSAFNVGSLYRTADACGCERVFTSGITPHPNGSGADKLAKSALGAELLVPSQHFTTTQDVIEHIREHHSDYTIIGMETTDQSEVYTKVTYFDKKIALVLGNEVTGVDTEIMPQLDQIVEIPTFGAKNSLNVAACAPVVLYEILRQWKV
jgi:23S rRNA (guanosine2251-2'-O)-methyltransferase